MSGSTHTPLSSRGSPSPPQPEPVPLCDSAPLLQAARSSRHGFAATKVSLPATDHPTEPLALFCVVGKPSAAANPPPSFFAVANRCYHMGGPLVEGQLRVVEGRTCVECPYHKYLIDVESGDGLYWDLDRVLQSKGKRQRVFEAWVDADSGQVMVCPEEKTGFGDYEW